MRKHRLKIGKSRTIKGCVVGQGFYFALSTPRTIISPPIQLLYRQSNKNLNVFFGQFFLIQTVTAVNRNVCTRVCVCGDGDDLYIHTHVYAHTDRHA